MFRRPRRRIAACFSATSSFGRRHSSRECTFRQSGICSRATSASATTRGTLSAASQFIIVWRDFTPSSSMSSLWVNLIRARHSFNSLPRITTALCINFVFYARSRTSSFEAQPAEPPRPRRFFDSTSCIGFVGVRFLDVHFLDIIRFYQHRNSPNLGNTPLIR